MARDRAQATGAVYSLKPAGAVYAGIRLFEVERAPSFGICTAGVEVSSPAMDSNEWAGTSWAGDPINQAIARAQREREIDSFLDHPGLTEQLLAAQGKTSRPWVPVSVDLALENTAILRAVSLLALVGSSLTLVAYRNGRRLPAEETPPIVKRPNPFTTYRDFVRDSIFNLACYGDLVWFHGARDVDKRVLSLVPLPPAEVVVDWDDRRWEREYTWRGVDVSKSVSHVTWMQKPGAARGFGPLQSCGAALSVAYESDDWAARFFAEGGVPSIVLQAADILTDDEAETVRRQWLERASNTARVASGVEAKPFGFNAREAQLSDVRQASVGDACRMFGIPGALEEYIAGGASLTYQNIGQVGTMLVRFTLAPGYLEPIEQAISDLLPRNMIARFEVDGLERADRKTRYETYKIGIETGILTPEMAQAEEGLAAGGVEFAPMPPNLAPVRVPSEVLEHG